jgi:hypothetical protein
MENEDAQAVVNTGYAYDGEGGHRHHNTTQSASDLNTTSGTIAVLSGGQYLDGGYDVVTGSYGGSSYNTSGGGVGGGGTGGSTAPPVTGPSGALLASPARPLLKRAERDEKLDRHEILERLHSKQMNMKVRQLLNMSGDFVC